MNTITYDNLYHGLPIMANQEQGWGCKIDILNRLYQFLISMTNKHNKTLFIRFDLRFPQESNPPVDNCLLSGFLDSFKTSLSRDGLDPHYFWVREQSREKHQHYHLILLLNGSKVQSYYHILQRAEYFWGLALDCEAKGLVDFCNHSRDGSPQPNGLMLRRGTPDFVPAFRTCFHWGSYLAKERTKGYGPAWSKEFGSSRIRSSDNEHKFQ